MHLVLSGLNAWNVAFLTVALLGGLLGASWHVTFSLLASVLAILAHSAVFALFIGAAKTLKETVGLYRLPVELIDRASAIYFRLFPWATAAALSAAGAAIAGGLAGRSAAWRWTHLALSVAAYAVNVAAAFPEHRQLRAMHGVLADMARAVPPEAERALGSSRASSPAGAVDIRARGKAILTLAGLALATLLGYRYVAGVRISDLVTVLAALPLVALMALGAYYLARGSRPERG